MTIFVSIHFVGIIDEKTEASQYNTFHGCSCITVATLHCYRISPTVCYQSPMVVICFPLLGARQDYADFFSGPIETIGVFVRIYVIIPLQKVDRENQRLYPRAMTTGTPLHILNQHSTVIGKLPEAIRHITIAMPRWFVYPFQGCRAVSLQCCVKPTSFI
jgi:hypothetical protein